MSFYADLHIHSKYSRATSKNCDLKNLTLWGRKKGITVIGTGDFTHPVWFAELQEKLLPAEAGLFRLKPEIERQVLNELPPICQGKTRFMLSVEISTIYKKGDKIRKIHHLIYAPSFDQAAKINQRLAKIGNIRSDGRPILGLDSRHLLEIVLEAGEGCYLVPAHIWTPWFAVLGSKSGFDRVSDCYGDLADHIFAVETGLSSDPEMNWKVSSLDRYRLVSNSDAHSPAKLGREANIFSTELDYFAMKQALESGIGFEGTVEFFPEEGKYHLDGHRKCGIRLHPNESRHLDGLCPECHRPLTLGVLYRVQALADRAQTVAIPRDNFQSIIPLPEILSETLGTGPNSKKVSYQYEKFLRQLGSEFQILNHLPLEDIKNKSSSLLSEAISRLRKGQVIREAGYDGEYGVIRLFEPGEISRQTSIGFLATQEIELKNNPKTKEPKTISEKKIEKKVSNISNPKDDKNPIFDEKQNQAINLIKGPLIIMAGPGSGKTRTLTHRIAHLIADHGIAPEKCLAITFTRRAAQELQERLIKLLPKHGLLVHVKTFHGLAWQILQENRLELGLPRGFRVLSGTEYEKVDSIQKERRECLSYEELIVLALELLRENSQIKFFYQDRFPWISVDEFQDVDSNQYQLLRQLAPSDANLCVIGDPDQSIYSFRGADVRFFLEFEKDYPLTQKIQLHRNYRSSLNIVKASQLAIQPSSLVPDRNFIGVSQIQEPLVIHQSPTARAEAEFVTHEIEKLLGGHTFFSLDSGRCESIHETSHDFSDFGVLFRTEAQGELITEALTRIGFPFKRFGQQNLIDNSEYKKLWKKLRSISQQMEPQELALNLNQHLSLEGGHAIYPLIKKFLTQHPCDWNAFWNEIALLKSSDLYDPRADYISLMTIHSAKGLEFPIVFIVGCEDGVIPLKWGGKISEEELAEERRLFFVGMTRAQEKLFLSYAKKKIHDGKIKEGKASPFLRSIDKKLYKISKSDFKPKKQVPVDKQLNLF